MFVFDLNSEKNLWIHLHGFATDISGSKIETARKYFRETGHSSFFAMDMDYEKHTTTEVLDVLEALVLGFSERFENITLCGSSHGGYVASNLLRLRKKGKVKRLVLLAPSFETLGLIVKELGREKVSGWLEGKEPLRIVEEDREVEIIKDWARDIIEKGYEIIEGNEVRFPKDPDFEIVIMHGERDEIVPIERTHLFVSSVRVDKFLEVDDDHQLSETFEKYLPELYL